MARGTLRNGVRCGTRRYVISYVGIWYDGTVWWTYNYLCGKITRYVDMVWYDGTVWGWIYYIYGKILPGGMFCFSSMTSVQN